MLSGYPPFDGNNEDEIIKSITTQKVEFKEEVWKFISEEAQDLIKKLLVPEDERISPKEILKHPWITKMTEDDSKKIFEISSVHLERLKRFQTLQSFKKLILTFIATRMSDKDILSQMVLFKELDKNKDGYITLSELKSKLRVKLDPEELKEIIDAVDTDKNGAINYTEFIAATTDIFLLKDEKKLQGIFALFDANKDGKIDSKDLHST
jgi:calcium-dependent protein kinase